MSRGSDAPHLQGIHCTDCGTTSFPPARFCARCSSSKVEQRDLGSRGVLHTWSTVYQDPGPSFVGAKPYTIVTVDLPEGVRVVSTLARPVAPEQLHRGLEMGVEAVEVAKDDQGNSVWDFRFGPASDAQSTTD